MTPKEPINYPPGTRVMVLAGYRSELWVPARIPTLEDLTQYKGSYPYIQGMLERIHRVGLVAVLRDDSVAGSSPPFWTVTKDEIKPFTLQTTSSLAKPNIEIRPTQLPGSNRLRSFLKNLGKQSRKGKVKSVPAVPAAHPILTSLPPRLRALARMLIGE